MDSLPVGMKQEEPDSDIQKEIARLDAIETARKPMEILGIGVWDPDLFDLDKKVQ